VVACQGTLLLGSLPLVDIGRGTARVALGDLNGDGVLDVAAVSDQASTASVLLGRGDGAFAPKANSPTGAYPYASSVALGDLNHDGKLDMVVANTPEFSEAAGSLGVFLGKGDGTFADMVEYPTGGSPHSLALAARGFSGRNGFAHAAA
jgi:hypothetical protein